ncbi:MAG: PAS domain S-box protein [Thermoplasmata archaeon]|nr:PAS domain S-box protein [Thermoplasmata archaeon]
MVDLKGEKKAGESHQNEGDRYSILFENSRDAIFIIGLKGKIIDVNQSALDLFGYTKSEILGLDARTIFLNDEERLRFKEEVRKKGAVKDFEMKLRHKNGDVMDCHLTSTVHRNKDGSVLEYHGIVRDITKRKKAEEALRYRIEFEKLIMSISTDFIDLPLEKIDDGIEKALERIGEFTGVDRSYVFRFYENGKKVKNTHEWCAKGIGSQIKRLQEVNVDKFPWFMKRIKDRKIVHIPKVNELSPQALAEKNEFERSDVKSLINVPMASRRKLIGFVGFSSVREEKTWEKDIISLIKIVGEIISNALDREAFEKELKKSKEDYEDLWDNAPVAYHTLDTKGIIRSVNKTEAKMLGYSVKEMVGKPIFNFILPKQQKEARKRFKQKVRGKRIRRQESRIYVKKDGSKIFVSIDDKLLEKNGKVVGIKTTMVDITELKKEKTLLEMLIQKAPIAIVLTDNKGKILRMNPKFTEMFGYILKKVGKKSLEEVGKRSLDKLIVPKKYRKDAETYTKSIAKGKDIQIETIRQDKDGKKIHVELIGTPFQLPDGEKLVYDIYMDITRRKNAEKKLEQYRNHLEELVKKRTKKLKEQKIKFEKLFERAPEAIIMADKNGFIKRANKKFTRMFGFSKSEVNGRNIDEKGLVVPDNRIEEAKKITKAIANKEMKKPVETFRQRRTKEGLIEEFPVSIIGTPFKVGRKRFHFGIYRDITERYKMEQHTHHRIQNELLVISEGLRPLSADMEDNQLDEEIHDLRNQIKAMKNLHREFQRTPRGINAGRHIERMVKLLFAAFNAEKKDIHFKTQCEKNIQLNYLVMSPIVKIVNELISNSFKHAFPPGFDPEKEITVILRQCGDKNYDYELIIGDNGIGLPKGFNIKNSDKLGLKLVKGLVEEYLKDKFKPNGTDGTRVTIKFNG